MSLRLVSHPKFAAPSQTRAAEISLGSLGQISSLLWLNHSASPYAAYGPTPGVATQPSAYPLALAAIQSALEFLDPGCRQNSDFFRAPQTTTARQTAWDSPALGTPAKDPTPTSQSRKPEAFHQQALGGTALTLSAPIAGAGNLILAARKPNRATKPLAQAKAPTRPARQNVVVRQSWLRTATKSPAFALSSAAINGLMLVSPMVGLAQQTTTTYGTGSPSGTNYAGGTIQSGDTVILNNGAIVTGAITVNGALQFNQTTNLTLTNAVNGNGQLNLTNTGNLTLAYNSSGLGKIVATALDLAISLANGTLLIGTGGGANLAMGQNGNGTIAISQGTLRNNNSFISHNATRNGIVTLTGGNWNNAGELNLGFFGNGTLNLSAGTVTSNSATIGQNNDSFGTASLLGGNWTNTSSLTVGNFGNGTLRINGGNLSSATSSIGNNTGSFGTTTIASGRWTNTGNLSVGNAGNGTLTISGGNVSNSNGLVGETIGSIGNVSISNGNWNNSGTLQVGFRGRGSLAINSGTITAGRSSVGNVAMAIGMATVAGGNWTSSASLNVGEYGNGTLTINGGNVTNTGGFIGVESTGIGQVSVAGGRWTNSSGLFVGNSGRGDLTISGGNVTNANGYIGRSNSSFGSATISSGNWTNSANLYVGVEGNGNLTMSGGTLTANYSFIGNNLGGIGEVTMAGGNWTTSNNFVVGNQGNGILTVKGGNITNTNGFIGSSNGSIGSATISSGNWTNSGNLYVGAEGNGNLTISGGNVYSANGSIGNSAGQFGTATLSNGKWTNTGSLTIGSASNGALTINGGSVSSANGSIGRSATGIGTAIVSSGNWVTMADLNVGYAGNGTLMLNGGEMQNSDASIGTNSGSNGIATITGGTWTQSGSLNVGNSGNGSLNLTKGTVTTTYGQLGVNAGSIGTATIAGGNWTNLNHLILGNSGSGFLTLSGGALKTTNGTIGNQTGSTGTVEVLGGHWLNTGNLNVAGSGNGTLTLTGGLVTVAGTLSKGNGGTITLNGGGSLEIGAGGEGGELATTRLTNNGKLFFNRSSIYKYSGIIDGNGALTKQGLNVLTLTGNNTYMGNTTINAGILMLGIGGTSGSISNSANIINNGMLIFNRRDDITYGGSIHGTSSANPQATSSPIQSGKDNSTPPTINTISQLTAGTLTKLGVNTLSLTGNNSYAGITALISGTLEIGNGGTSGAISSSSDILNNGHLVFNRSDDITYGGSIVGANTITQLGKDALNKLGISNINQMTEVITSQLEVAKISEEAANDFAALAKEFINDLGASQTTQLPNTRFDQLAERILTQISTGNTNQISATDIKELADEIISQLESSNINPLAFGTLTKLGSGTLILTGNNSYRGNTTIAAGTLKIGAGGTSGAISDSATVINNANLIVDRSDSLTHAGTITGSGNFFQIGSGTLTLEGTNSYLGKTTIGSGSTLALQGNGSIATSEDVFNSGTLDISKGSTTGTRIKTLTGNGITLLGNQPLILSAASGTNYGNISGQGSLTVGGVNTYTLMGTNSYLGKTIIETEATLALAGDGSIATSKEVNNSGTIDFSKTKDGATLTNLIGNGTTSLGNRSLILSAANGVNSGTITGDLGNLTINGAATYTLSGMNRYTGATTVGGSATLNVEGSIAPSSGLVITNGATLSGNGTITGTTINAGGILAPNNAARSALAITGGSGNLSLTSGSISNFSIIGATSDRLTASGSINLDGILNLAFSGDNYLTSTPYTLFSGTSRSGSFSSNNVHVSGLSRAYQYALDYTSTALQLRISSVVNSGQTYNIANSGYITLSGGTLEIDQAGSFGNMITVLTPDANSTYNTIDGNGVVAVLTGTIDGNGPLTFSNFNQSKAISKTTLSGSSSYTGRTTVESGAKLSVNGSIAGSASLSIQSAAILAGNGTVPATIVQSGGAIAPGNSIGTLTINGDLMLNRGSASRFMIESNRASSLNVGGAATLGGTINIDFSGGNYDAVNAYTFITAPSISQQFDAIITTGDLTGYRYSILYGSNAVQLGLSKVLDTGMTTSISNPWSTTLTGGTVAVDIPGSISANWTLAAASGSSVNTFKQTGNTTTLQGIISGSGDLTVTADNNGGTLILAGANTYTGSTTLSGGIISVASPSALGSGGTITFAGGTLRYDNGIATDYSTQFSQSANQNYSFDTNNQTIIFASSLDSYAGSLVKKGVGTLILSGNNSYSGSTTIEAGTLVVGAGLSSGALNSRSDIINQSKLVFNRSGTATYSGQISGGGSLEQIGSGTLALSGNNTYTGATTIAAGSTLALVDAGTIETSSHVVNHGFLSFAQAIGTVGLTNLTGSGTTDLGVQSLILNNAKGLYSGVLSGAGGVSLNGSDTYSLSGNNTYTGVTSIGNGETLALLGSGSISASSGISNSGNFSIVNATNAVTIRNLTGSGSTNLGNQTLNLTNANGLNSGVISGLGGALSINGSGTYNLSGLNTYTGATTIGVGSTLSVTKGGSINSSSGIINSGSFSVDQATSPVTITNLTGSGSTNLGNQSLILSAASGRNDGVISGQGGALTVQGAGTYSLSGFHSYTGATTIATGSTLALVADGSINPSSGVMNNGSLSIAAATSPVGLKNMTGAGNTILGNQTLTLTNANGLNSGVISGLGGALSINGSGTYSLSAANTYTGATSIGDGSTLALLESGSISASSEVRNSGNFSISNATSAVAITTLNGSGSTTLGSQTLGLTAAAGVNSGVISGNGGNLLIGGSGTYTLRGLNTYTGSTSLSGHSTLVVEGSISPSSALTVSAGATLSGSGNLPSATISSGAILAPNNAGTSALSITGGSGNLTLSSGSTSNFSISPTSSDRLTANGAIKLGGSLNLAFTGERLLTETPYVLFSGQSLNGTFSSIATSGLPSLYLYSLDYSTSALNLWLSDNLPAGQSAAISGLSSVRISGGTIIIDTSGSHNTSLVLADPIESTTNTIDSNGLSVALTGDITGTGPLTFTNSQNTTTISNIILSGNNTYTGATVVDAGARLSVNGSIASSANLTVNAGAIVGGNGTLPATTLQSGGLLAPGNSIGLLTAASLNFGSGGILDAEFQGPQNDKTTVTGSVTNFTGSANLSPYGGGNPWPNFDYQLITAANSFTTSSSLTLSPVGITSALLLQGTTPVQEVDGNPQTFDVMWRPNNGSGATASAMAALGQGNRNQLAASGVFDSAFRRLSVAAGDASGATTGLNATGSAIGTTGFTTGQAAAAGLSPEFLSTTAQLLGISSNSQLTAAISTITPESYAAFQSVGLETLQRQRQQLLASAGQCASNGWVINAPTTKAAKAPKNPICLYGQAANANSSINGQDGLSSYNANLFSSFYGLEVKANPYWRFGAAYGYGTSNLNGLGLTNAWVTATVNSGSLYGVYTPTTTSPWTFKGLLGYGNYALNGSRQVAVIGTGTPITGSTTANGLTAALTAEVAIPLSKPSAAVPVLLKPLIGLAYGNYQQAGFSESGGGPLNLNVDGNSVSSLIGTIGLELTSAPIPLNKAKTISLVPKLALAYQVDALAGELGNSSLSASMPASGSGSFLTQGQNRGVNGFSIAAGADLALGQSTALYANVNVEAFSSGNQVGYGGGLRFKF